MGELHRAADVNDTECTGAFAGLLQFGVGKTGGPASTGLASVFLPLGVGLELGLVCEPELTCRAEHW
eukprot:5740554-Lingulodinium_polyedra.AAC.1